MVQGCLEWQRNGLQTPDDVVAATATYRDEMDLLGAFIAEYLEIDPNGVAPAGELRKKFDDWCSKNGTDEIKGRTFAGLMRERGFKQIAKRIDGTTQKVWVGCRPSKAWAF
jgi:putative DNA primase/helicase